MAAALATASLSAPRAQAIPSAPIRAPISTAVKNAYDVDLAQINIESLIYMIAYVPVNFPANYVIDYYGLRLGVTVGIVLTALGGWLKSFVNSGFYWIYVGQTFCAIG